MNWIPLTGAEQPEEIRRNSFHGFQVIFKHSTRCSISHMAKSRLDNSALPAHIPCYYLDLLSYRAISDKIAEMFSVHHESPQVLIIKDGECVYEESHSGIRAEEIYIATSSDTL